MQANLPLLSQGGLFIGLLLTVTIFDIRKVIIPDTLCLVVFQKTARQGIRWQTGGISEFFGWLRCRVQYRN